MAVIDYLPKVHVAPVGRGTSRVSTHRAVTIYCGEGPIPWDRDSERVGVGGSEESILALSREWRMHGYEVEIYSRFDPPRTDADGVHWLPCTAFDAAAFRDTLVIWRCPLLVDHPIQARRVLLDVHDVIPPESLTSERLGRIGRLMLKSHYHRGLYPFVADAKCAVVGNGIDLSHFDQNIERNPNALIYASGPERGLELLLEAWPGLRRARPNLELHVYYGWGIFDLCLAHLPGNPQWKARMVDALDQPGIFNHGRVGLLDLARAFLSASVLAYPCTFDETFCITAVKAQAAGCVLVTARRAALPEVVSSGALLDPARLRDEFPERLLEAVTNAGNADRKAIRAGVERHAWSVVAEQWEREFA